MARIPRHHRSPDFLTPGQCYHVTNRGVDRGAIFGSDLDRIVFLSLLADACIAYGVVCHAWCLMTNHYHLVIEDTRGLLSQTMHSLQFCYARYFNDTRRPRRSGPLFESRFGAELIDTVAYFHDAVAYVHLNPVRTTKPLAAAAEAYRWSSAALVCTHTTPDDFGASLLAKFGGITGVLGALPCARNKPIEERRRHRLEALVSGAWMDRDRVLAGRSPELYRDFLLARVTSEPRSPSDRIARTRAPHAAAASPPIGPRAMVSHRRFGGLDLAGAVETVSSVCKKLLPGPPDASDGHVPDVVAYILWRMTASSAEAIATRVGRAAATVVEAIRSIRSARQGIDAWDRVLRTIEWALRWRLRAAPYRV
jgi:REP element-mobilizing transposase RayT